MILTHINSFFDGWSSHTNENNNISKDHLKQAEGITKIGMDVKLALSVCNDSVGVEGFYKLSFKVEVTSCCVI